MILFLLFFLYLDWVFREDCKTAEVYEARTREIVSTAVRGFNDTLIILK